MGAVPGAQAQPGHRAYEQGSFSDDLGTLGWSSKWGEKFGLFLLCPNKTLFTKAGSGEMWSMDCDFLTSGFIIGELGQNLRRENAVV